MRLHSYKECRQIQNAESVRKCSMRSTPSTYSTSNDHHLKHAHALYVTLYRLKSIYLFRNIYAYICAHKYITTINENEAMNSKESKMDLDG